MIKPAQHVFIKMLRSNEGHCSVSVKALDQNRYFILVVFSKNTIVTVNRIALVILLIPVMLVPSIGIEYNS